HRDMKPENVLFESKERGSRPLIADLGLAKHFRDDTPGASQSVSLSVAGEFRGTAGYMSPEQLQDAKSVGPPADVFATGAILYECLTGTGAFEGESMHEVFAKVTLGQLEPVRKLRPEAPPWLADTVQQALATDQKQRFSDGGALARALEERKRQASGGGKLLVALALVALLVVSGAVLVALNRSERTEPAPLSSGSSVPNPSAPKLRVSIVEPTDEDAFVDDSGVVRVRIRVDGNATSVVANGSALALRNGLFEGFAVLKTGEHEIVASARAGDRVGVARRDVSRPKTPERGPSPWFPEMPESARPRFPLPKDVEIGAGRGEYVNTKDRSVLVYVPAGVFKMGRDDLTDYERPVHDVDLSAFFVGKLEVTQAQFEQFVRDTRYVTEPERDKIETTWRKPAGAPPPLEHPVSCVTWLDAREYCRWAGLRLPTEAEWEKAACWDPATKRQRVYPWGDQAPGPGTPRFANVPDESLRRAEPERRIFRGYDDGFAGAAPVGKFPAGASAYGALDMFGNVAEWCEDEYVEGFYGSCPRKDPVSIPTDKRNRVFRGGGFLEWEPTAPSREFPYPQTAHPWLGFRVARSE
ncbi:SUMF1/EgtB/PvdO family nonheme iron enzyme, partial [bacterium]|nr:SUMF1/EgtB/PvdO family nonheme iron enzyme [bacterium]